ncbi:MAG: IS3 family transposase [Methylophilus sp.]
MVKAAPSVPYKNDQRQTGLIKQYWLESGGVYGYRKVYSDIRAFG